MTMNIIKVKNYDEMSKKASELVVNQIKNNPSSILGLATGSTPEGLYLELIKKYNNGEVSFKDVTSFNLDEYVGLAPDHDQSYNYYMNEKLFNHVDIDKNKTHLPNGIAEDLQQEVEQYEQKIAEAGGIDLQILGIGTNGHIGFNEPGTPFTSRTHVVELDESTREANSRFFASIDDVPTHAISSGIATIMNSKQIVLLVSGKSKAEALHRLINGDISEDFPASVLKNHPNVTIIADEEAFSA